VNSVPTPVDFSTKEPERDVYTLESGDPLFTKKTSFEKPVKKKPTSPQPKQASQPYPKDLPSSFYEANGESYLRARRVAEMKFNTLKLVIAFTAISAGLIALDVLLYPQAWWCQWPVGCWAFVLLFPVMKSFVFRGKDLRSVIEGRLHKMALREVERFDSDMDGAF
jgi:hypothetical protein